MKNRRGLNRQRAAKNLRCRNNIPGNFRSQNGGVCLQNIGSNNNILSSILTRLSNIERKLSMKNEG